MVVGVPVHPQLFLGQLLAHQCFSSCFVVKEAKVLKAKVVAKVVLSTKDRVTVAPLGQASGCTTSGY